MFFLTKAINRIPSLGCLCYRGIEAENAHFQPSAWEFLTTKHSRRFGNDVALALPEKIEAGMDFRVANRL